MFNRLRIGPRLILLILVQTVLILGVGAIGLLGLNQAAQSTNQLRASITETALVSVCSGHPGTYSPAGTG